MKNKQLERYILSLPEEDRQAYRNLIEEALQRDAMISETVSRAKEHAEKYEVQSQLLRETTAQFNESMKRLNERLRGITEVTRSAFPEIPLDENEYNRYSTLRH